MKKISKFCNYISTWLILLLCEFLGKVNETSDHQPPFAQEDDLAYSTSRWLPIISPLSMRGFFCIERIPKRRK